MSDIVKVFGCRPMTGGAANSEAGVGVRKPPGEEIAGRDTMALLHALWRFGRFAWGAGLEPLGSSAMINSIGAAELVTLAVSSHGRR